MTEHLWLEIAKLVVTSLVTLVVGIVALSIQARQRDIAEQQARTAAAAKAVAHAKLNLDLFHERFAVFEKFSEFLSDYLTNGHLVTPADFSALIPKAQFLFGKDIANYMREASDKRTKLATTQMAMARRGYLFDANDEKLVSDLEKWFFNAASDCHKHFAEYLDFSSWKADPIDRMFNSNRA
jgi:K+-sensing histidine kinase KdpD